MPLTEPSIADSLLDLPETAAVDEATSTPRLPPSLRAFVRAQAWLTGFVIVYSLVTRIVFPRDPFVWPIQRGWHFSDFFCYRSLLPYLHTSRFFTDPTVPFLHPATVIPLYVLFSFHHAFRVYALICVVLWGFAVVVFWRILRLRGIDARSATAICVAAGCSYPLAFSLERGNFETLIAFGVILGTWAFLTGRYNLAAVLWGVFGCMKLYPLLLLALFLPSRRFKQFGLGIASCGASMVLALWYTGPTVLEAYRESHTAVSRFVQLYPYNPNIQGYEHSFFGLVKLIVLPFKVNPDHVWAILSPSLTILMLVLYFWKVVRLPISNQLLFLTIGMIALPPCSFDYTLLHLYAPLAVIVLAAVDAAQRGQQVPGLATTLVLLALVLAPQNYLHIHWLLFQGALKGIVLVALLVIAVSWPLAGEGDSTAPFHLWQPADGVEM